MKQSSNYISFFWVYSLYRVSGDIFLSTFLRAIVIMYVVYDVRI
jgi:hypothetical protein